MASNNTLFLLDGMALAYRAYFSMNKAPRVTSTGLDTSAVFGFTNTLLELLNKEAPTHIAVVFDTSAPTARHIEYEKYKAQRQEMPEALRQGLPYIRKVVEAFNIPVIAMDGYEADDVIGTIAWQASERGYTTFMMTPDKDFGQLVRENVYMYKPARMGNEVEVLGVKEILAKWSIDHPKQVIDILGLWGDASDNIPGVPGIGEKTAKDLVQKYGSMENIFANLQDFTGRKKENLETFQDQGLLSKRLATINTEVPIVFEDINLIMEEPNKEALLELFRELEFRTLGRRIFGEDVVVAKPQKTTGQLDLFGDSNYAPTESFETQLETFPGELESHTTWITEYKICSELAEMQELAALLLKSGDFCFDSETTSLDPITCNLVGLSFAIVPGEAWYVPISQDRNMALTQLAIFKPVLEDENCAKSGQNLKFDIQVLAQYQIAVKGKLFDTMLAHYLIEPDMRHNMDYLAETYLNYKPISITELIGKKGKNQGSMQDVPLAEIARYAAEDADVTLRLKHIFEPRLAETGVKKLFEEVEMPLMQVLAEIELTGINLDEQALKIYSKDLEVDIQKLELEIYEMAGTKFNIASPKQLGEVLFELLKLDPKAKKTKTGQYKTDEEVLTSLAMKHEMPAKVLEFRSLQKLKSTYVDALPTMINPKTGRVHTSFNQAVAATGRLSSNNPNLQNIPIRTEKGREVRKAFIPAKNNLLLSADYSQIELRIITEISGDENMLDAFKQGVDIHTATAAKVFKVPLNAVDSELRRKAKTVNFGIIYGISAFGLSQRLGIPRSEAAELIQSYFETYPGIKAYMDSIVNKAREYGFVETLLGRRRYIKDITSNNQTVRGFAERNAINAPIQGSAADMIKVAMIEVQKAMKQAGLQSKMMLQVHDELVFDVIPEELDTLKALVLDKMQHALPLKVPILVEMGAGNTWLEAH